MLSQTSRIHPANLIHPGHADKLLPSANGLLPPCTGRLQHVGCPGRGFATLEVGKAECPGRQTFLLGRGLCSDCVFGFHLVGNSTLFAILALVLFDKGGQAVVDAGGSR